MPASGADLHVLGGYPFEVRHVAGSGPRAQAAADIAAGAYGYLGGLLEGFQPDIALVIADRAGWPGIVTPYGMPFFSDEPGGLRPGVLVVPAGVGGFWLSTVDEIRVDDPSGFERLRVVYPDESGQGVDLQPFFDLVVVHELGHAFETLGRMNLPTYWLSEIFANLALHSFIATQSPGSLPIVEVFSEVGANNARLTGLVERDGISTLDAFEDHYTDSEDQMSTANYLWFQYRFQRLAADVFNVDGQDALVRFWRYFRSPHDGPGNTAGSLVPTLSQHVSETLGAAVASW